MLRRIIKAAIVTCCATGCLLAQTDSRAAEITAAQEHKATELKPDEPNKVERVLTRFNQDNFLENFSNGIAGFRPKIGGLANGSGFALGPEWRRTGLFNRPLAIYANGVFSFKGYQKYELGLDAPRLGHGLFFADFHAVHHNYPSLSYYGSGPDSNKSGRTDFRLEDTALDATLGMRPTRHLSFGATEGYLLNNVGPGTDTSYASAETVYSPVQAPGIDQQANFLRSAGFVEYDWRDNPGGPRRGGDYSFQFADYRDRTFGVSNFRRLDMEAQQYFSILNQRRVFALHAKSTLTYPDGDRPLPFYMQPWLGSADDLRGYRPFRFRGNNLMVMSAEYRWEVFSGLDMALFTDAGQVAMRRSDFNFSHLESDVGFGFRFNVRNQTFLRLDVGFSHEGFQIWLKFKGVFNNHPVRTASSMGDF